MKKIFFVLIPCLLLTGCIKFSSDEHSTGWGKKSSEIYEPFNKIVIPNATIEKDGKTQKTISFKTDAFTGSEPKNEQDILNYVTSGSDLLDDIFFYENMNITLAPIYTDVQGGLEIGKSNGTSGFFSFKFKEQITNISITCRTGFINDPFKLEKSKVGIYNMGVIPLKNSATKSSEITYDEYNFNLESTDTITIYSLTGRVIISSISYWK